MADNIKAIELLFGVAGGGNITGESGKKIKNQLTNIANHIKPSIVVKINEDQFKRELKKLRAELQQELGAVNINPTSPNESSSGGGKGGSKGKQDTKTYKALKQDLEAIYRLRKQISGLDPDSKSNERENLSKVVASLDHQHRTAVENAKISEEQKQLLIQQEELLNRQLKTQENINAAKREGKTEDKLPNLQKSWDGLIAKSERLLQREDYLIQNNKKAAASAEELRKAMAAGFDPKDPQQSAKNVDALRASIAKCDGELAKISVEADTFGFKIKKAFETKVVQNLAYAILALVGRAFKQVYDNVVKLDDAVTDLQIATGGTREETERLVKQYAQLAKQLGATVTQVTGAADTWLRQGYDTAETNELIANTLYLAKLGQLDSAEAAKALTSAMKGYNITVDKSIDIVDKFTAVDMAAAVSAGDIATAMSETAVSANTAGVSMDRLIGYIATVAEVTQDGAESVGTFYKTMFARMSNIKAGRFVDDETGESLNDVASVLNEVGVSLFNAEGQFKSFETVLDELGKKWTQLDTVQKSAIATAIAGTRQQEKFRVLMENYSAAMDLSNVSAGSSGNAVEKYNESYLNSITAKLEALEAAWQEFSTNVLDSDAVKAFVEALIGVVNALNFILSHLNTAILIVPALTSIFSKLLANSISGFSKLINHIKTFNSRLKDAKKEANEASAAVHNFVNTKGNGKTAEELDEIYQKNKDSSEQLDVIQKKTGLAKEDAEEFIRLKKEEAEATEKATKLQAKHGETMQTVLNVGLGVVTALLAALSQSNDLVPQVIGGVVAGVLLIGSVIVLMLKKARDGVAKLVQAERKSVILSAISIIVTSLVTLISLLSKWIKTDEELKEEAREASKKMQEEADAIREVANAAKDARNGISELIEETKKLFGETDDISNSDWIEQLEKLGNEIVGLYDGEELSSLQAINQLLEEEYSYIDLINMSERERLELLERIRLESSKQAEETQKQAYREQKKASNATVQAAGSTERVKASSFAEVDDFLENIYSKDVNKGIKLKNTGGKNFKITIDSSSAKDFVEEVSAITSKYEEIYKNDLGALDNNQIYQYFSSLLKEGEEALKKESNSLFGYVESLANSTAIDIPVNIDAEDAKAEYDKTVSTIIEKLNDDEDVKNAIEQGLLKAADLEIYASEVIARNYSELYNKIKPEVLYVPLKKLEEILDEVEGEFDLLNDAMRDMEESGIISADTISTLKKEFPELIKYLKETANGFELLDGALSKYIDDKGKEYLEQVIKAQEQYENALEAYENSTTKTLSEYKTVLDFLETLENAIANAEGYATTIKTITDNTLQEQYQELLESQVDVLDEQCEKYKELCDIRRDLLSTYQEELDYQRELRKRQKDVADLQTQLTLAKMDNSASGRARQRELQEQLNNATEELEEYTLDKAIEDLTKKIDSSEKSYENFIKGKIDEINNKIADIAKMSTEAIVSAITSLGKDPTAINPNGSNTPGGDNWNNVMGGATASARGSPSTPNSEPETPSASESEPDYPEFKVKQGRNTGLSFLKAYTKEYYENNTVKDGNGNTFFKYNEEEDLWVKEGEGYDYVREKRNGKYEIDIHSWEPVYKKYHTGGFVGGEAKLQSNEEFAKLLKGEFVSTPGQIDNFIKNVLPAMVYSTGKGATINNNSPLIVIECNSIAEETLPELEKIVSQAVKEVEKNMANALSRTGYRKK